MESWKKCAYEYWWRPENTSEHKWGLAIDINPNENYMVTCDGVIVAGSFWDQVNNLYSVPEKGITNFISAIRRQFRQSVQWYGVRTVDES